MVYASYAANIDAARSRLWRFAKSVLEAQQRPRSRMHILLNFLAAYGRIKVISTNVDGLELIDQLDPQQGSRMPSLSKEHGTLIQLHGNVTTVACSACWATFQLDLNTVNYLITGTYPPCNRCTGGRRAFLGSIWRPDILFYDDPREAMIAEDADDEWTEQSARPAKKRKRSAPEAPPKIDTNYHYSKVMSGQGFEPAQVFIVGSSLFNERLRTDIARLCDRGVQAYIVNPASSTHFNSIPRAIHIQVTSEDFATRVCNAMIGRVP
jgi:hypothetical protein